VAIVSNSNISKSKKDKRVRFFIYYLLINIKIEKSVIPHQCISVINEADIVLNKKIKIKIKIMKKIK